MSKWGIVALLAAALAPMATAQMRGGGHFGPSSGFSGNHGRRFAGRPLIFADPFWYSDYPSGSLAYDVPAPPVIMVQRESVAAPGTKSEPLLIEWQGDRFVRFGAGQSVGRTSPDYSETASLHATNLQTRPASITAHAELAPAVLIFRDGHQEEVSDYVISSGVLYARADYATSGSWRKNIQLAALDLHATLKANQENGVKFVLPAGPNEVVTRP